MGFVPSRASRSTFAPLRRAHTPSFSPFPHSFTACTLAGFVISLVGAILLFIGATIAFAFLYAVGTLISLAGTGFLVGFWKQIKMVSHKVHASMPDLKVLSPRCRPALTF